MASAVNIQETLPDRENPGGFSHVLELDGLRGLAILLILINHLLPFKGHSGRWLLDVVAEMVSSSWVGVNLFFALSGFLITSILIDTPPNRNFFRVFYTRRILRIFPLYYGFLFLLLLLTKPLHFSWNGWQFFYFTYTANLALWWDKPLFLSQFRISHFWSLQVEEQFYLAWPLFVYAVRSYTKLIPISLFICLAAFILRIVLVVMQVPSPSSEYLPYSLTFCCCDNLLYGCALALILRTRWREKVLSLSPFLFAGCFVPVAANRLIQPGTSWVNTFFMPTVGFSLIGIGSASLIAMSLRHTSLTRRIFIVPFLRFFGRYSYGLYVLHYSVYGLLSTPLHSFFIGYLHSRVLSDILSTGLIVGISVALAMLSYHLYEVHFLRLKRYFSYYQPQIGVELS
jgi:peptidoglycan/LPS O-acetylase OafA/YrhL